MTKAWASSTQRQYPLLYWTTMAYIVGIPNFVHFDVTGRKLNPINLSSISLVFQVAITGYVLVVMLLLERRPIAVRKIRFDLGLWVALLLVLMLATVFEPASRLTPPTTMTLLLSLFRLAQWVIAFVLIVALYSRTPPARATELVVEVIGRSSWIWIGHNRGTLVGQTIAFCGLRLRGRWQTTKTDRLPHGNTSLQGHCHRV